MIGNPLRERSPFFSRTYGGFTPAQKEFVKSLVPCPAKVCILDPMSGQADFLARYAWKGSRVLLGDLNAAVLCLARLRQPSLIKNGLKLADDLEFDLKRLRQSPVSRKPLFFHPDWLADQMRADLKEYADLFNLRSLGNPFAGSAFWACGEKSALAIGIALIAARDITSYRSSDNVTWLKQGGLQRVTSLAEPFARSLVAWRRYAADAAEMITGSGTLETRRDDISVTTSYRQGTADLVITSPPYANRLDYARLWAPEVEVLCALLGIQSPGESSSFIGSNVIRNRVEGGISSDLPESVQEALAAIREDRISKASESYYFPFFRNYAVDIMAAMRNTASLLRVGGRMVVFVRDTVRKDIVFPTAALIAETLEKVGLKYGRVQGHVVRKHIGLRRKREGAGLLGLAQQEWWMIYEKL